MQIKLLKDIITSIVGVNGVKIVELLYEKKNVNEFLIAKKLNLTINQTRNILYRIADEGLVSFIRKKDNKKGGWYIYFWTLSSGKSLAKFKENLSKSIGQVRTKMDARVKGRYFCCINCNIEYDEENALLNDYTCKECGETLQLKDNSAEIAEMQKEIAKYESLLAEVNAELEIIGFKDQKTRDRKAKLELKKKAAERLARKKEKEKLAKKNPLKKPAKKDSKGKHAKVKKGKKKKSKKPKKGSK